MSDAVYVDDEPESFVERNPITTGVAAAVTPLATKKEEVFTEQQEKDY